MIAIAIGLIFALGLTAVIMAAEVVFKHVAGTFDSDAEEKHNACEHEWRLPFQGADHWICDKCGAKE